MSHFRGKNNIWRATKPLGEAEIIYTSCDATNDKAISLYQTTRFEITGEKIDGEIVFKLGLLGGNIEEPLSSITLM